MNLWSESRLTTVAFPIVFAGPVDDKFGKRMLRLMSALSSRAVRTFRALDQLPVNQSPLFLSSYQDLTRDPVRVAKSIYNKVGLELTPKAEESIVNYVKSNPQNKYGRHVYSLEQYGLTKEEVRSECKAYEEYMRDKGFENVI